MPGVRSAAWKSSFCNQRRNWRNKLDHEAYGSTFGMQICVHERFLLLAWYGGMQELWWCRVHSQLRCGLTSLSGVLSTAASWHTMTPPSLPSSLVRGPYRYLQCTSPTAFAWPNASMVCLYVGMALVENMEGLNKAWLAQIHVLSSCASQNAHHAYCYLIAPVNLNGLLGYITEQCLSDQLCFVNFLTIRINRMAGCLNACLRESHGCACIQF